MTTLKAARAMVSLGFACHWLRARSKAPVGNWADSASRKSWAELKAEYRPGYNVGVRLGTPSKFEVDGKAYYLAVLDCDCKSKDPRHRAEMEAKARASFASIFKGEGPGVRTGRGNGSAHHYALTETPVLPRRIGQSAEKVKVKMPSVKASKTEEKELSREELAAGWRLRPAWEVSLMGDGQQVVVPPSTHPDTGRGYEWAVKPMNPSLWPVLSSSEAIGTGDGARKKDGTRLPLRSFDWQPLRDFDLGKSGLDKKTIAKIEEGLDCQGDRSATLFSVSMIMASKGLTDDEILTVLTDRENYLGQCAYDHTNSADRATAARWVKDYTLDKARREISAAKDFEDHVLVEDLTPKAAKKQRAKIVGERDWRDSIERPKGKGGDGQTVAPPKNTQLNVVKILQGAFGADVFKKNLSTSYRVYGVKTPWGGAANQEIRDAHLALIKQWCAVNWRFEPSADNINNAITCIAEENAFHPIRDYLDALEWDGVRRVNTWFHKYMGATGDKAYVSAVGRKLLVAMVARVYEPGVKYDQVVILEGDQGEGKSTLLRHLVGDDRFTDSNIDVTNKDCVQAIQGKWLIELGELSSMKKADVDDLKTFISRTADELRLPYARLPDKFPRQCVFVGTTNNTEYLTDPSGNRRYWPVRVNRCDFDAVKRDRDQLFAEASLLYSAGEALYLERGSDEEKAAIKAQAAKMRHDIWEDELAEFFDKEESKNESKRKFPSKSFRMLDLFSDAVDGPFAAQKQGQYEQMRIAAALKKLGFKQKNERRKGHVFKVWTKDGQ